MDKEILKFWYCHVRSFYSITFVLRSSVTSTLRSLAVFIKLSKSGWLELVHHWIWLFCLFPIVQLTICLSVAYLQGQLLFDLNSYLPYCYEFLFAKIQI